MFFGHACRTFGRLGQQSTTGNYLACLWLRCPTLSHAWPQERLEKSCNMDSQQEQHECSFAEELEKRREIQPCILLYVTLIAMCTQLRANRGSSHGNDLIGILSFLE